MTFQAKIDGQAFHRPFEAGNENEALAEAVQRFDGMLCGPSCSAEYLTPNGETITVEAV